MWQSAYNMLLGRPSLNTIKAIPSVYHMVIKFPTTNGVGIVQGDQRVARECYSTSMKQKEVDNIHMDDLDIRDELSARPTPSEKLEPVRHDDQPEHLVYIESKLADQGPPHLLLKTKHRSIFLEVGGHGRS